MTVRVFVDESKERGYLLVATHVMARDLAPMRRLMRQFRLPGQQRIHFAKEGDRKRRKVIAALCGTDVRVVTYDAAEVRRERNEIQARIACLEALVADAAAVGAHTLILEVDESLVVHDQRVLFQQMRKVGCDEKLVYDHLTPHDESLLWISDAVAWCWAKGGDWQRRVRPMVDAVRILR